MRGAAMTGVGWDSGLLSEAARPGEVERNSSLCSQKAAGALRLSGDLNGKKGSVNPELSTWHATCGVCISLILVLRLQLRN